MFYSRLVAYVDNSDLWFFLSHKSQVNIHFYCWLQLIPISYYDELPRHLPKTVILQGTGGCLWKVAMRLKQEEEEVYLEQGWPKFVKDNALVDGDFMTFVYNGDNIFEVSIYGLDGCKQARAMAEEEEEGKDSICALSSDDTEDTNAESESANTVQRSNDKGYLLLQTSFYVVFLL